MPTGLERFLHPRTAALIGVPEKAGRPGYSLFQKIRAKVESEGGRVFAVNPKAAEIDGVPCYPRLQDVPGEIDVAVIMVSDVLRVLEDCREKRPAFAVIFTAGFAETGAEGTALQERVLAIAREAGFRLFGPNTNLNAFEIFKDLPGRKISVITQSGHQGRPIVQGEELGIPFRYWIPTGNEVDLDCCDFIEHLAGDDETAVIAAYIEGFKDGDRLRRAAVAAAEARKPVVLIKVGRSQAGSRMALAHTGHLAGSDRAHDGFFRQYGWVRVDDLDELLETAALFARLPRPARRADGTPGEGVCIYGISGGTGALLADLCGAAGIALPPLTQETQARLRQHIPSYLTVANPVDNGATPILAGHGEAILDALLDAPEVDLLVCPIAGALPPLSDRHAEDLARAWKSGRKPMIAIWSSPKVDDAAFRTLVESGMPLFRSFRNAVKAIGALFRYHTFADAWAERGGERRSAPHGNAAALSSGDAPHRRAPLRLRSGQARSGALQARSDTEASELLAAYGIVFPRQRLCADADEVCAFAKSVAYPIALKISSADIPHKTDTGLVRLNLGDDDEARRTFDELTAAAHGAHPRAAVDGVLAQEMVSGGVEMLVGAKRDEILGPVVAVGFGGVFVEVLDDVAVRTVPLRRRDVEEMLRELRGFPLLDGARGRPRADIEALVDVVLGVAALAADYGPRLLELDLNPLMVLPAGRGAVAVDVLLRLS